MKYSIYELHEKLREYYLLLNSVEDEWYGPQNKMSCEEIFKFLYWLETGSLRMPLTTSFDPIKPYNNKKNE